MTVAHVIDVVVVAHDAGELLLPCIDSVFAQRPGGLVIVVDTDSTDGSVEAVRLAHPDVLVLGTANCGFAAANNMGLAHSTAPFVLLLNPDAELRAGALDALLACALTRPRAAIVGAKVLDPSGTLQANQAGRFPSLLQVVGLRIWRAWQSLWGNASYSPHDFPHARRIDWVTGACMLVRRSAVEVAGGMDESYFLYYEDIEWCRRMRDKGWEVWQTPEAEVVHHLGRAGGQSELARRAYRESFFRYCDQQRLWGLKAVARLGLALGSVSARARSGSAS
jgi:N-acetylglucosaminyl-diphospho-decaprenol L-rhamnosyltransferase